MAHAARILADSISPYGVRLTTMEVVIPRIVLAEFNTHRMFSRNSASSRAIPVEKMLRRVQEDPYVPSEWGKNQKGMQAGSVLTGTDAEHARIHWLAAMDHAVLYASKLLDRGVHKQLTNRLLEPWLWHTIIVSATEWDNFFHLRCHPDAHPDIRKTAKLMYGCMQTHTPRKIGDGEWHLPLIWDEDREAYKNLGFKTLPMDDLPLCSIGRCARVSYLTHDGRRDITEDIALARRLLQKGHMSPFEHVARPMTVDELRAFSRRADIIDLPTGSQMKHAPFLGNFRGWVQYRKMLRQEWDIKGPAES